MKIFHDCRPLDVLPDLPADATLAVGYFKCSTCKQRWRIKQRHGSASAERVGIRRYLRTKDNA